MKQHSSCLALIMKYILIIILIWHCESLDVPWKTTCNDRIFKTKLYFFTDSLKWFKVHTKHEPRTRTNERL